MSTGGLEDFDSRTLQILRERSGITRKEIAVRCAVTVGTARGWETGRNTPSEAKALLLSKALGVHPSDLTNTPRNQPSLRQLRQWRGLTGAEAARLAGIGITPLYTAESYVSPIPKHIVQALASAYSVSEKQITGAWDRGRSREFGDIEI